MDDALRTRLDAIVGLLAVVALLLVGVVVGLGGVRLLLGTLLVGFVLALVGWITWEDHADRSAENESVSSASVNDESQ